MDEFLRLPSATVGVSIAKDCHHTSCLCFLTKTHEWVGSAITAFDSSPNGQRNTTLELFSRLDAPVPSFRDVSVRIVL